MSNGSDDSIPVRVKSQCILLRANIDEFEKSKKNLETAASRFPDENILKIFDRTSSTTNPTSIVNDHDAKLKFYQTLISELEFHQHSTSMENSNAMQQD